MSYAVVVVAVASAILITPTSEFISIIDYLREVISVKKSFYFVVMVSISV